MNVEQAIQLGQLLLTAYNIDPDDLADLRGANALGDNSHEYGIISSIYANELATDASPEGNNRPVSMGFVAQDAAGDVVVVIRGTQTFLEWVHDAAYDQVPFAVAGIGVGFTEDGFTGMYRSLRT